MSILIKKMKEQTLVISEKSKKGRFGRKKRGSVPKWLGRILLFLLFLSALAVAFVFYSYETVSKNTDRIILFEKGSAMKNNPDGLITSVQRHILLPSDEKPSVATIINVEQLKKSQPFYMNAHNGDKLLIYFQAKKAVIYDPMKDIIINIGPLILEQNTGSVPATSTTSTLL